MNRLQSFFTRYELTTFFVLVYVMSFLCIVCNCITALVIAWKTRFRLGGTAPQLVRPEPQLS